MIGELIAERYELEAAIGTGGMSDVYKARDLVLERFVALKVLRSSLGRESEFVERFRREARAVAQLSHPNIVTVIDRGESGGSEFIAFEFVEGDDLKRMLERDGPFEPQRAIEIVIAVASGLAFAHAHGFVHRDVKPQNILITPLGEVKLTDFGIARSLESAMGTTQTGTLLGTCAYLSPEQASGRRVTPSADVYSLGVVLYELLTGEVPFCGDDVITVALKHLNEPAPSVLSLRPDLPCRLAAAVDRALAKEPAERFASMNAFAAELRACLELLIAPDSELTLVSAGSPAEQPSPETTVVASRAAPRARGRALLAALVVLLAAGALAIVLLGRSDPDAGRPGSAAAAAIRAGALGAVVPLHAIGDYNPSGPADTLADTAPLATGSGAGWHTQIYYTPEFGNLLRGLGLLIDAGRPTTLARISFRTSTPGFVARILAGDSANGPFRADSALRSAGATTSFGLDRLSARYYVLWVTRLPLATHTVEVDDLTARRS